MYKIVRNSLKSGNEKNGEGNYGIAICSHFCSHQRLQCMPFFSHVYLCTAVFGLHCCVTFSLVVASRGRSVVAGRGLLVTMASPVAGHYAALASTVATCGLSSCSTWAAEHRLSSCCAACGILLGQESNPCLLHWQGDSLPLSHQGSPVFCFCFFKSQFSVRSVLV